MRTTKRTEQIKVLFSERERADLQRHAWSCDRSPSDLVHHIVCLYLYGHARMVAGESPHGQGTAGPESGPRK